MVARGLRAALRGKESSRRSRSRSDRVCCSPCSPVGGRLRIAVPRAELGRYPRQNKVAIGGSVVMLRETGLHPLRGLQFFQEESGEVGRDWVRYAAERATRAHAHALPAPRRKSDLARPYYGSGFVTRPPDRDGGARALSISPSLPWLSPSQRVRRCLQGGQRPLLAYERSRWLRRRTSRLPSPGANP